MFVSDASVSAAWLLNDESSTYSDLLLKRLAGGAEAIGGVAALSKLSFYDAAYLELALRKGLPLASLDQRLATAAKAAGVSLEK